MGAMPLWRMRWNTSSFDRVELSELQGIEVKQGEREKSPDTGRTRTLQLQVGSTSLNYEITKCPQYILIHNVSLYVFGTETTNTTNAFYVHVIHINQSHVYRKYHSSLIKAWVWFRHSAMLPWGTHSMQALTTRDILHPKSVQYMCDLIVTMSTALTSKH